MIAQTESQKKGIYFWLLLVPLFWGGAFGAAKHVITELPPLTAAAIRFGCAGLILLMLVIVRSEWNMEALKKRWPGLLLMALTGIFAYNAFFFMALSYTSAINGALIMATTPVIMTLGAVLFLKESLNKRLLTSLVLSLIGVLLVIMKGSFAAFTSLSFNVGDLLFLGALLCWACHGLVGKAVMQGVSPLFATTITTVLGSIFLAISALFVDGWTQVYSVSVQSWIEMVYMTVFATVIAFFLWNQGIHQIGASKASMYMNLVPINATWIAVWLYESTIATQQLIGMGLVIAAVYLTTTGHRPQHPKKSLISHEACS